MIKIKKSITTGIKNVFKNIFRILVVLTIVQGIFVMADYYSDHPECMGISKVFDSNCLKVEYKYNKLTKEYPQEMKEKVKMYNEFKTLFWIAFLFFALYEIANLINEPEEHWIYEIKKKIDKISKQNDYD